MANTINSLTFTPQGVKSLRPSVIHVAGNERSCKFVSMLQVGKLRLTGNTSPNFPRWYWVEFTQIKTGVRSSTARISASCELPTTGTGTWIQGLLQKQEALSHLCLQPKILYHYQGPGASLWTKESRPKLCALRQFTWKINTCSLPGQLVPFILVGHVNQGSAVLWQDSFRFCSDHWETRESANLCWKKPEGLGEDSRSRSQSHSQKIRLSCVFTSSFISH